MDYTSSLLSDLPNSNRPPFERTTPFPAVGGCYRSKIYTSDIGINPLVAACDQILSFATILKNSDLPDNVDNFLQDLTHEIRAFEHNAQIANCEHDVIVAARYALCCLLDGIIMDTHWGREHNWGDKSLLLVFHNESYGGARFFTIIERALENVSANLHLIELLYLCLNLGFVGKYQNTEHGHSELLAITNRLYQVIGHHIKLGSRSLLVCEIIDVTTKSQRRIRSLFTNIDLKKVAIAVVAATIVVIGFIYLGINLKLNDSTRQLRDTLERVYEDKVGSAI